MSQYIQKPPFPDDILIIFQLIFGATAAFYLILSLASCLKRLNQHRQRRRGRCSRDDELAMVEVDVGEDFHIVMVRKREPRSTQSPPKSALWRPERKGSLGKSVRWASEIAIACGQNDQGDLGNGAQELLY